MITIKRKKFNVTGTCYPEIHYMVDITSRLERIKKRVSDGEYFVMNRARQYGKTTTLQALKRYLANEYTVIFMSFQEFSQMDFRDENMFCKAFLEQFLNAISMKKIPVTGITENVKKNICSALSEADDLGMRKLFSVLGRFCGEVNYPVVLLIDEVDQAANNQVFLDFLGLLRTKYLSRFEVDTFQSVILAGVYDIKNLKQKIRQDEQHKYNSPWNIAEIFDEDMSFSAEQICKMLDEYAHDQNIEMDLENIAEEIYSYTSGYPFLVSSICKYMDEKMNGLTSWTKATIGEAVKHFLKESNTLFDDLRKQIAQYPELKKMLYAILFQGKSIPFNQDIYEIDLASMFGFVRDDKGSTEIANRIFEMRLYNMFLSEDIMNSEIYMAALTEKNQFIKNDHLDMDHVMRKFCEHYTELYSEKDSKFVEEYGRKLFLLYLKPIINGTGNYYIEARTRDMNRTDIIVDYQGERFIIELKIWRGDAYNSRGEKQLIEYLEYYKLRKGWLLSFNFNKNKTAGVRELYLGDKTIIEAVV